jgi:hypothetical protein
MDKKLATSKEIFDGISKLLSRTPLPLKLLNFISVIVYLLSLSDNVYGRDLVLNFGNDKLKSDISI